MTPRRREILDQLAGGERSVGGLVELLGLAQPQVSKHLPSSGPGWNPA
jgi:DNA-binding transcriptional ArsR family regulator